MATGSLSFNTKQDAVTFAKQQQQTGLYPIVYKEKSSFRVIICESEEEYRAMLGKLRS